MTDERRVEMRVERWQELRVNDRHRPDTMTVDLPFVRKMNLTDATKTNQRNKYTFYRTHRTPRGLKKCVLTSLTTHTLRAVPYDKYYKKPMAQKPSAQSFSSPKMEDSRQPKPPRERVASFKATGVSDPAGGVRLRTNAKGFGLPNRLKSRALRIDEFLNFARDCIRHP